MKKSALCLFAILVILTAAFPASADRSFLSQCTQKLYDSDSGMGASDTSAVLQTKDGYIWAASYSGLLRYDGTSFVCYNNAASGFTAQSATSLYEDQKGRFWVGTNDNGLYRRERGLFIHIRNKNTKDGGFNSIRAITSDKEGDIFVGSTGGIGRVVNDSIERIVTGLIDDSFVLELVADSDDLLWGVTRSGAVFIVKDGKLLHLFSRSELLEHSALSVVRLASGGVLVGTSEGGVLSFAKGPEGYTAKYHESHYLENIEGLFQDSKGRVWAGGDNGFGYFSDANARAFHPVEGSLMDSSIEAITEDYEHNFWVSSSRQGLLQITRNKFTDVNFAMALPTEVVNATCLYGSTLYIGTDNGLYAADRSLKKISTPLTKLVSNIRVRDILKDSKGGLWISTYKEMGLVHCDAKGDISFITKAKGLPDNRIRLCIELADGDIAVGMNNGVSIIRNNKVIKTYTAANGVINTTILSLCEVDGALFIGTDGGGIFEVKNGKVKNYTKADGLQSDVILRMFYDKANRGIWISTGSTLAFYDFKKIRNIKFDASVNSGIFDIMRNVDGRLMVIADTGIHLADAKALLEGRAKIVSYVAKDGLRSTVTANSWNYMDDRGILYLCCAKGVYAINMRNIFVNKESPRLAVNRVVVDGRVHDNPESITLSSGVKRLTLDLAVLSFVNPDYNVATYQLRGFDREPVVEGGKELHSISYTNLKGGDYNFVFHAANSDGTVCAKPLNIFITKDLKFSEKPLVILFCMAAAVLLIFALTRKYYRKRSEAALKRQSELREITTQAMKAMANTIDAKDPYTRGHSLRVADYSVAIAKELGFTADEIDNLYYTALLHDIGKIGVPDNILNKPSKLTDEEYAIIKKHPTTGGEILKNITVIDEIKDGAEYHHEKYDGTGYNKGLKGEEIPLVARIICVADSVDAMSTTRPYRARRETNYVISELERCSGTQFDPKIAGIFIGLLKSGKVKLE